MDDSVASIATRYFNLHPELRQEVLASAAFKQKLAALESTAFEVDQEKLYFPWGDTPKGLDDLILDDLITTGRVSFDAVIQEVQE